MNKILDPKSQFLDAPNSRGKELQFSFRVMLQLLKGLRRLHFAGPCITVFRSARLKEDNPYCQTARGLAGELEDSHNRVLRL